VVALIAQLRLAIASILQLRELVWRPLEHLFLLVRVATLIWTYRVLSTSTVSFCYVLLAELANGRS